MIKVNGIHFDADLFEAPGLPGASAANGLPTLERFVADAERGYLSAILQQTNGRAGAAAGLLDISRKTPWEK